MPLFPTPAWYYAKSLNKSFTCDISKPPFDSLHSTLTSPLNVWSWVVCKKRMKKTNVVHYVSVNWKFQVDKYRVKKNKEYLCTVLPTEVYVFLSAHSCDGEDLCQRSKIQLYCKLQVSLCQLCNAAMVCDTQGQLNQIIWRVNLLIANVQHILLLLALVNADSQ